MLLWSRLSNRKEKIEQRKMAVENRVVNKFASIFFIICIISHIFHIIIPKLNTAKYDTLVYKRNRSIT